MMASHPGRNIFSGLRWSAALLLASTFLIGPAGCTLRDIIGPAAGPMPAQGAPAARAANTPLSAWPAEKYQPSKGIWAWCW